MLRIYIISKSLTNKDRCMERSRRGEDLHQTTKPICSKPCSQSTRDIMLWQRSSAGHIAKLALQCIHSFFARLRPTTLLMLQVYVTIRCNQSSLAQTQMKKNGLSNTRSHQSFFAALSSGIPGWIAVKCPQSQPLPYHLVRYPKMLNAQS